MRLRKPGGVIWILFILAAACAKEHSFEGAPNQVPTIADSTITNDSTVIPGIFPDCTGCNSFDTLFPYEWSFKVGSSLLCGDVTRGVLSNDSIGMTFFGPSACSVDSGLIITAYFLNAVLTQDQSNITADKASLQYYDNTTSFDVLQSKTPNIFSLTIDSYQRGTGIVTGSFGGWVVHRNGNVIKVDSGKFRTKLE